MGDYTKGRLYAVFNGFHYEIGPNNGPLEQSFGHIHDNKFLDGNAKSNAARLAAAWNAFEGIDTIPDASVKELAEALAALADDFKATADSGDHGFYDANDCPVYQQARAALTKWQGEG